MKKILVIDDNKPMRMIISAPLKQNYEVITQPNGHEAYFWMIQERIIPDLITCDIENSPINGYEFLEMIRSSGFFCDIPIIVISGCEAPRDRVKSYKLGAQDYLHKPFNPEVLIALIEKNLNPKIRLRNFDLPKNERLHYYKLGALEMLPEGINLEEVENKLKEKINNHSSLN
jgi:DNA-binding response OmpR family regulator